MEVEVFLVPPAEVDNLVQNAIGALAVDRPAVVEGNPLGRASICAENHDSRARREWSQAPRRGEGLQDRRSALELVASRSTDFPKDGYLEAAHFGDTHRHVGRRHVFGQSLRQQGAKL